MTWRLLVVPCVVAGLIGCFQQELKQEVTESYPNGNKKTVTYYRGGKNNVERIVRYFADGQMQSDRHLTQGEPDSLTTIY